MHRSDLLRCDFWNHGGCECVYSGVVARSGTELESHCCVAPNGLVPAVKAHEPSTRSFGVSASMLWIWQVKVYLGERC